MVNINVVLGLGSAVEGSDWRHTPLTAWQALVELPCRFTPKWEKPWWSDWLVAKVVNLQQCCNEFSIITSSSHRFNSHNLFTNTVKTTICDTMFYFYFYVEKYSVFSMSGCLVCVSVCLFIYFYLFLQMKLLPHTVHHL